MQLLSSSVGIEDKKMVCELNFDIKPMISKGSFNIPGSLVWFCSCLWSLKDTDTLCKLKRVWFASAAVGWCTYMSQTRCVYITTQSTSSYGGGTQVCVWYVWNTVEGERIWERSGVTAGNWVIRVPEGKAKENTIHRYEKLDFIGISSHRTAPLIFTLERI